MKYIAIYCGSSIGNDPTMGEQARLLGKEIVKRGYGIVYGGASVGLMGEVAQSALDAGGEVIGVLPEFLKRKELEYNGLTELHIVNTMHERKAMMAELSDAFIALPGGWGTMEELFEMLTWGQLALHKKPIGILNLNGYYDALISLNNKMIDSGFLKEEYKQMMLIDYDFNILLDKMEAYVPPKNDKWFKR